MNLHVFKAKCPICKTMVLHAAETDGSKKVEFFEPTETKMLVIVATPEIDGKKRIALGPCQRQEPFYREGEEPIIYFAHVRHGCLPPLAMRGSQVDTSTATMLTSAGQTIGAPSGVSVVPEVITTPASRESHP